VLDGLASAEHDALTHANETPPPRLLDDLGREALR
jgi:hypothetical protein